MESFVITSCVAKDDDDDDGDGDYDDDDGGDDGVDVFFSLSLLPSSLPTPQQNMHAKQNA